MNWHVDQEQSRLQSLRRRIEEPHEQALRLAVLAAHPDDETIGASALLARFPQSLIIYLTDGAPRDRNLWPPGMAGEREQYAAVRRREAAEALGISLSTLKKLINAGYLRVSQPVGIRRIFIKGESILAMLDQTVVERRA